MIHSKELFPRRILPEITKYLDESGIILLVGARQVGKTSIMYLLKEELESRGISEKNIFYLDLEDISILNILNSGVKEFSSYLQSLGANTEQKNYIFIDEIQYMENPTNFLKLLADHHKHLKLIVSGSSTLEIRKKFRDSLAGRKIVFEVYPLDFHEFLIFKREKKSICTALAEGNIRTISPERDIKEIPARFFAEDLARYFNEYSVFGGYPTVAMESDHNKKIAYLMDIYNSYVKKDIKDIMRVDNITAFNKLLMTLSLQAGNLVNISELCNTVKIARETLERYIFLLENTFIIKMLSPFSSNPRKEISKMSKVYFIDSGLRNIIIKNFDNIGERVDSGALIENSVFSNLLKNSTVLEEIHFWRTLAKNEIDFVLVQGKRTMPIEVKYSYLKSPKVPVGIRNFMKDYTVEKSFVLTKDFFGKIDNTILLPVWLC